MKTKINLSFRGLFSNYAGLPSSIYLLFIARIINRFGGFVHAFLAMFLSMYLDMSASEIGNYVLMAGLAGFLGAMVGGPLGDKLSRKKVYLTAQGTAALLFIPCGYLAYVGQYEAIPLYLIASSFFSSVVRPVNTAMVTDLVSKEDRKRAFSLLYLGINIGVALGPLVAAILLKEYLVWFFLGDALTTFIAVLLVGIFVEEHQVTEEEINAINKNDSESQEQGNLLMAFLRRPIVLVFVVFSVITSMMYAQIGFAFPLLMGEIYGDNGPDMYARLTTFNAVVVIMFTSFIHYITKNIRPIYNIAMAAILYSVGLGMMAIVDNIWLLVLATYIWTLGEIQAVTNQNVFLMGHTPINYRSRFLAVISIITSVGYIVSPKLGGIILDTTSQKVLWSIVFVGGLIAAAGYGMIGMYESHKEKNSTV